jgi:hypothetical protein
MAIQTLMQQYSHLLVQPLHLLRCNRSPIGRFRIQEISGNGCPRLREDESGRGALSVYLILEEREK